MSHFALILVIALSVGVKASQSELLGDNHDREDFKKAIAVIRPPHSARSDWASMSPLSKLKQLFYAVRNKISNPSNYVDGDFVECGVWRGGSSMAMMYAEMRFLNNTSRVRDVWLFDTFEGMPPPTKEDNVKSHERYEHIEKKFSDAKLMANDSDGSEYIDQNGVRRWNYVPLEIVKDNVKKTGYPFDKVHVIAGKVEETLPLTKLPEKIAILRLDTDFYTSTKSEFALLEPRLAVGGLLIIDDFCTWDGARKATNEFLKVHGSRYYLEHQGLGEDGGRLGVCFVAWRKS